MSVYLFFKPQRKIHPHIPNSCLNDFVLFLESSCLNKIFCTMIINDMPLFNVSLSEKMTEDSFDTKNVLIKINVRKSSAVYYICFLICTSKQASTSSARPKTRAVISYRLFGSYHFLDLKRTDVIPSRRRHGYALESYPLIPLAHEAGRSRKKRYTFFFRITGETEETQKEEEEKDRGCLFAETRLRSTTRTNPPLAKRPTLHVAYLRQTDGHTREGPSRAAVSTRRVSLSQKSRKEGSGERVSSGGDVAATELNSCATGVELLGAGTSVFLCKSVMVCHKIAREESPANHHRAITVKRDLTITPLSAFVSRAIYMPLKIYTFFFSFFKEKAKDFFFFLH